MATTTVNLADYVIGDGPCTVYRFPNGHTASVHNDAGKLTVWCEVLDVNGDGETVFGLTSAGVDTILTRIHDLPGN